MNTKLAVAVLFTFLVQPAYAQTPYWEAPGSTVHSYTPGQQGSTTTFQRDTAITYTPGKPAKTTTRSGDTAITYEVGKPSTTHIVIPRERTTAQRGYQERKPYWHNYGKE